MWWEGYTGQRPHSHLSFISVSGEGFGEGFNPGLLEIDTGYCRLILDIVD